MKVFFSSLLHTKYTTENVNNFLNNDFRKKRVSFIETLRTLLFTQVSLKSSGLSISEKIRNRKPSIIQKTKISGLSGVSGAG